MGTVDGMADPPFGFSDSSMGDTPPNDGSGRDKHGKNDPSDPLAAFGISGDFGMGDLGQIFTQLGQMFSNAGSTMAGGSQNTQSGPINYALTTQVATNSIGFVAPIPATTHAA